MKFVNILRWILRIVLLVLLIILIIDNMQTTTFNFLGIYHATLPLIILILSFLALGIVIGFIVGIIRNIELKAKINMLEKELKNKQTSSLV